MPAVYRSHRRPGKRWGRRLFITFLVLLFLGGGLAVVADRVGVSYAERLISDQVAQQVSAQKATSGKPTVKIEGVPFLTQVLSGKYQEIRIGLPDFSGPAGDGVSIKMPLLDVRASDLRAPLSSIRDGGDIVASTVTGTGTIAYPQLLALVGQKGLKLSEKNGKLIGTAPVQALGQTFTVSGTAVLTVAAGVVQVRFTDLSAAELPNIPVIRSLMNAYVKKLALDLKVPALPLNLVVQKVQATADGLQFTAGASNVTLSSGGL